MSLLKFEPKDAIERCGQRKDEQLVKRAMVCGKRLAAQRSRRLTPATAEVEPDSGDEWWKRCRDCEFHLSCWSSSTRVMQTCASDLSVVALPTSRRYRAWGPLGNAWPPADRRTQPPRIRARRGSSQSETEGNGGLTRAEGGGRLVRIVRVVVSTPNDHQVLHRILILGPLDGLVDHLMLAEQVSALQLLRVDLFRQLRVEDLRRDGWEVGTERKRVEDRCVDVTCARLG
eukprot:5999934-Prymnesium_polylepis.2